MRKITISFVLFMCVGLSSFAQEMNQRVENDPRLTKNGYRYLPVKGDYAIGIEATPFFEYLGNMFTDGTNKAPLFNGTDNTIYGKYFLENNRAVRAKLRLNIGKDTYKGVVPNDEQVANNPLNPLATALDLKKVNSTDVELRVGYEFRRGHGRVQGFWGGEVGFGIASGKIKYDHGNPMTTANPNPNTWDFANVDPDYARIPSRATEAKLGNTFSGTIAAFAGVEYFFAPQLSIGGELNLGFTFAKRGQDETTYEYWNASSNNRETQTLRGGSWIEEDGSNWYNVEANSTGLFTKVTGQIFLLFYF